MFPPVEDDFIVLGSRLKTPTLEHSPNTIVIAIPPEAAEWVAGLQDSVSGDLQKAIKDQTPLALSDWENYFTYREEDISLSTFSAKVKLQWGQVYDLWKAAFMQEFLKQQEDSSGSSPKWAIPESYYTGYPFDFPYRSTFTPTGFDRTIEELKKHRFEGTEAFGALEASITLVSLLKQYVFGKTGLSRKDWDEIKKQCETPHENNPFYIIFSHQKNRTAMKVFDQAFAAWSQTPEFFRTEVDNSIAYYERISIKEKNFRKSQLTVIAWSKNYINPSPYKREIDFLVAFQSLLARFETLTLNEWHTFYDTHKNDLSSMTGHSFFRCEIFSLFFRAYNAWKNHYLREYVSQNFKIHFDSTAQIAVPISNDPNNAPIFLGTMPAYVPPPTRIGWIDLVIHSLLNYRFDNEMQGSEAGITQLLVLKWLIENKIKVSPENFAKLKRLFNDVNLENPYSSKSLSFHIKDFFREIEDSFNKDIAHLQKNASAEQKVSAADTGTLVEMQTVREGLRSTRR